MRAVPVGIAVAFAGEVLLHDVTAGKGGMVLGDAGVEDGDDDSVPSKVEVSALKP